MRFRFVEVRDGEGHQTIRPVFWMRLESAPAERPPYCLLDTGSPDTFMAQKLAEDVGIDLTDAEPIEPFCFGGAECRGLRKAVNCVIQDCTREVIRLNDIPVIFTEPWEHPGFGAVLGTTGMQSIMVAICAGERWIELTQAPAIQAVNV